MLQNHTLPVKKRGRKDSQKISCFRLCKIFYLNVDAWQNGLGNLYLPCSCGQPGGYCRRKESVLFFDSGAYAVTRSLGSLRARSGYQQLGCSAGMYPPLGLGHPQAHFSAPEETTASGSLYENKLDYQWRKYLLGRRKCISFLWYKH